MRILTALITLVFAIVFVPNVSCQTIQVTGTVKDGNGHPFNGALITVNDDQRHDVGQGTSNSQGFYSIQAGSGAVAVACQVFAGSTTYSPNPDHEPLTIKSNKATGDCRLYQVTNNPAYWTAVVQGIDTRAENAPNAGKTYTFEWNKINSSGLPPDSKAAAARQLKSTNAKTQITDPTFTDYAGVDEFTLSKALHGDQKALATLPLPVAEDVKKDMAPNSDKQVGDKGLRF